MSSPIGPAGAARGPRCREERATGPPGRFVSGPEDNATIISWRSRGIPLGVYQKRLEAHRRVLSEHRGAALGTPSVLGEHPTRSPDRAPPGDMRSSLVHAVRL